MKGKKCLIDKCNYPVWSKGYCKLHIPKRRIKQKKVTPLEGKEKKKEVEKMWGLFTALWVERGNKSEISDTYLGKTPLSIFFHHILEKRNYPEYMYDPENIIILTPEEHQKVENDKYYYEEINKRREALKTKYDLP